VERCSPRTPQPDAGARGRRDQRVVGGCPGGGEDLTEGAYRF